MSDKLDAFMNFIIEECEENNADSNGSVKKGNCDVKNIKSEDFVEIAETEKAYREIDLKQEQFERRTEAQITWLGKDRTGKDRFLCDTCCMEFRSIPNHLEKWHSKQNKKENTHDDKIEQVCVGNELFEIVTRSETADVIQQEEGVIISERDIEQWGHEEEVIIEEEIEETQVDENLFKIKKEDPSQENEFICSKCDEVFSSLADAKLHICSATSPTVPTRVEIKNETINEGDEKPSFECAYCNKTYDTFRNLIKHDLICKKKLNNNDDEDDDSSDSDNEEVDIPKSFVKKKPPPIPPRQFDCSHCNEIFTSVKDLSMHSRLHNLKFDMSEYLEEEVICLICNTVFSSKKNLKLHLKMHYKVKTKTIEDALPYGAEMETEGERHFFCEICNKSFAQKLFTVHKNMHQNVEEFACRICNKRFENSPSYDMHMKLHADKPTYERPRRRSKAELSGKRLPFPCNYCSRAFQRPHEKVKHERVHTGEKPYECEVCGKSFRVAYSLTLHLRTHTNVRPFVCPQCNKRFKSYPVYAHHLKIHSDERSYKCPYCPKSFRTAVQLCGHRNSHTKPFNCPECNRPFGTMYAVKIHMKTHNKLNKSGENIKHSCNLCGAVYARLFALRYHMKEHHGKDAKVNKHENGVSSQEDENPDSMLNDEDNKQYNEDEIPTSNALHAEEVIGDHVQTEEIVTDWIAK